MKIIISPAKKMRTDIDSLPWRELPYFLADTERLLVLLRQMGPEELKALWKCNDKIAQLNIERLANMDLRKNLTPAILAYEGIQYQYMAPGVFTGEQLEYIQEHLRILSGFYGILKPFDAVVPYRLEMQAKLATPKGKDLYAYWGTRIADRLFKGTDCVLNLASKEYSVCVSKYMPPNTSLVSCVFGEEKDGKIIEKGTMCKMARGEMVRYMAEGHITDLEQIRKFDRLNYCFDLERSDERTYIFVKKST